jgi:hypothetical protein
LTHKPREEQYSDGKGKRAVSQFSAYGYGPLQFVLFNLFGQIIVSHC